MKYSEEMADYVDSLVAGLNVSRKRMFGAVAWFAGGDEQYKPNIFCGVDEDYIFLRLSEKDRDLFRETFDEAQGFDPMGDGKPMREYMVMRDEMCSNEDTTFFWLNKSYQYSLSLPFKKKKPRKNSSSK